MDESANGATQNTGTEQRLEPDTIEIKGAQSGALDQNTPEQLQGVAAAEKTEMDASSGVPKNLSESDKKIGESGEAENEVSVQQIDQEAVNQSSPDAETPNQEVNNDQASQETPNPGANNDLQPTSNNTSPNTEETLNPAPLDAPQDSTPPTLDLLDSNVGTATAPSTNQAAEAVQEPNLVSEPTQLPEEMNPLSTEQSEEPTLEQTSPAENVTSEETISGELVLAPTQQSDSDETSSRQVEPSAEPLQTQDNVEEPSLGALAEALPVQTEQVDDAAKATIQFLEEPPSMASEGTRLAPEGTEESPSAPTEQPVETPSSVPTEEQPETRSLPQEGIEETSLTPEEQPEGTPSLAHVEQLPEPSSLPQEQQDEPRSAPEGTDEMSSVPIYNSESVNPEPLEQSEELVSASTVLSDEPPSEKPESDQTSQPPAEHSDKFATVPGEISVESSSSAGEQLEQLNEVSAASAEQAEGSPSVPFEPEQIQILTENRQELTEEPVLDQTEPLMPTPSIPLELSSEVPPEQLIEIPETSSVAEAQETPSTQIEQTEESPSTLEENSKELPSEKLEPTKEPISPLSDLSEEKPTLSAEEQKDQSITPLVKPEETTLAVTGRVEESKAASSETTEPEAIPSDKESTEISDTPTPVTTLTENSEQTFVSPEDSSKSPKIEEIVSLPPKVETETIEATRSTPSEGTQSGSPVTAETEPTEPQETSEVEANEPTPSGSPDVEPSDITQAVPPNKLEPKPSEPTQHADSTPQTKSSNSAPPQYTETDQTISEDNFQPESIEATKAEPAEAGVFKGEKDDRKKPRRGSRRFIYILSILATIGGFLFGYDIGIVAGSMLFIAPYFELSYAWHELIVSGTIAAAAVAALLSGWMCDKIGRKITIMISGLVFTAGGVMMGTAPTREVLLVGRIISGFGVGFASVVVPMYVAEASPVDIRGRLVSLHQMMINIGIVISSLLAGGFSYIVPDGWRYMLGFAAVPGVIQFIGFIFMPESPRWLVGKGRYERAEAVLKRMRGGDDVSAELNEIVTTVESEQSETVGGLQHLAKIFKTQQVRRALFVGCALLFFQQWCGINTVIYYSGHILKMAGFPVKHAIWLVTLPNLVNFLSNFLGIYLVERIGRRPLLISSLAGTIVGLVILAVGFQLASQDAVSLNSTIIETFDNGSIIQECFTTHSSCESCVKDKGCGFCYDSVMSGTCLPSFDEERSSAGRCVKSSGTLTDMKWAYEFCPSEYTWIVLIGMAVFVFAFAPGLGPMPWTINAEIYPLWARSTCQSISAFVTWVSNLAISFTFLTMTETITIYGSFYLFTGLTFIGVIFMCIMLPETRNKSLEEVEQLFMSKRTRQLMADGKDKNGGDIGAA